MGRTERDARNLRGRGIGDQPIYTKFGQLNSRKSLKIIATRCHILRPKCTKLDSWCLSEKSNMHTVVSKLMILSTIIINLFYASRNYIEQVRIVFFGGGRGRGMGD